MEQITFFQILLLISWFVFGSLDYKNYKSYGDVPLSLIPAVLTFLYGAAKLVLLLNSLP